MSNYRELEFPIKGDDRGALVAIENLKDLPFEIKRLFYIFGTDKNVRRGLHANKISEFVLICVQGNCKVLVDDCTCQVTIDLDSPNKGLYLNKLVWKEMYDFSEDAVLLVLSNHYYDKDEYISSYEELSEICSRNRGEEK